MAINNNYYNECKINNLFYNNNLENIINNKKNGICCLVCGEPGGKNLEVVVKDIILIVWNVERKKDMENSFDGKYATQHFVQNAPTKFKNFFITSLILYNF